MPDTLSGGQRKRAALTAALLTPSDLLILDEPTNHLDSEMIEWLQDRLHGYRGALLMVTHDRYFLDEVTSSIWEIERGRVYDYEGNFEKYLETKQARMDYAWAAERKMAALYRQDLAWMMRGARARSTKQKAHIQRFEALRDRDKIVEDRNVVLASLPSRMGNTTIEAEGLSKGYGDHLLFRDFTYTFLKNDRVGIIGPNGCGKSTLLKIILGQTAPDTGRVTIGQTIRIGYFGQENEVLPEDDRVIDYVRDVAEYIPTPDGTVSASAMCERFLFEADKQYAPIGKLSGGEKRRLYLLRVLMDAPNVLILDEPTNDLDIQTLQILEDYSAWIISRGSCWWFPMTGISWTGWSTGSSALKRTERCCRVKEGMRNTGSGGWRGRLSAGRISTQPEPGRAAGENPDRKNAGENPERKIAGEETGSRGRRRSSAFRSSGNMIRLRASSMR